MATRGNRPLDPQDTKGGVRGTHGLGDAPREDGAHAVSTQGGTASRTGGSRRGGILGPSQVPSSADHDEATGEEHGFEMASAIGDLESADETAARRERDAASARSEIEGAEASDDIEEGELGDPRSDAEEARERNLSTVKTPGPGPKDENAGRATVKHLEDHGLRPRR